MTLTPCPREREIADLLHAGHWPHACTADLHAHAAACSRCRDLILVTQSFQSARAASARAARFESPGVLWWRAQLRRRRAAYDQIGKPVKAAQVFALIVNLLVLGVFALSQAGHGLRWFAWFSRLPEASANYVKALWTHTSSEPNSSLMLLALGLGALALLSVVALYFAAEKE
jgi:hypothetical protein